MNNLVAGVWKVDLVEEVSSYDLVEEASSYDLVDEALMSKPPVEASIKTYAMEALMKNLVVGSWSLKVLKIIVLEVPLCLTFAFLFFDLRIVC